MDAEFWHERWRAGQIGFHRTEVNPWLESELPGLGLAPGSRVLVPLCGKSLDLGWLAEQGLRAVGVELSPVACAALFEERGVTPARDQAAGLDRWSGDGIELYCCDFLDRALTTVGPFAALWDRAALIALPREMRPDYVAQCARLLETGARGLLVSLTYDPQEMDGPPFSVPADEVRSLYGPRFALEAVVEDQYCEPSAHLRERGLSAMYESVWRLQRRDRPPRGTP